MQSVLQIALEDLLIFRTVIAHSTAYECDSANLTKVWCCNKISTLFGRGETSFDFRSQRISEIEIELMEPGRKSTTVRYEYFKRDIRRFKYTRWHWYSIEYVKGANTSRLYGNAPGEILDTLANSPSTSNFHIKCLTPENFTASGLDKFYDISATSEDDNGLTFIASIEAKNYPIWGVQFHPEKNMYEWRQTSIPHSARDVAAGQYFANFFVNEG